MKREFNYEGEERDDDYGGKKSRSKTSYGGGSYGGTSSYEAYGSDSYGGSKKDSYGGDKEYGSSKYKDSYGGYSGSAGDSYSGSYKSREKATTSYESSYNTKKSVPRGWDDVKQAER